MDVSSMTRQQLIDSLLWSDGGAGWGVCAIGNMFSAILSRQEIKSCVTVQGDPDSYTDDELRKLVVFSEERSANHRRVCGNILSSDNLTVIRKQSNNWLRKRRSWEIGSWYSETLDDAIAFMSK